MRTTELLELWVNQSLIIESENGSVLYSQIMKIDNDFVHVLLPTDKDREPIHQIQLRVTVYFYNETRELFAFKSTLKYSDGRTVLDKPDIKTIWKVQRRNFFRVPASLNITLDFSPEVRETHLTHDISGGGLTFISRDHAHYEVGDEIKGIISLYYDQIKKDITFLGKFVSIRSNSVNRFLVAIAYTEMKDSFQGDIIRYCNQRQFEIRRKLGKNAT